MTPIESLPGKLPARKNRRNADGKFETVYLFDSPQEQGLFQQRVEAALASQPKDGELLALAQLLEDRADDHGGDKLLTEAAQTLRTLASRRVTVDDAMVERGLRACRDDSDARLPRYKVVRAILEAAMQSDSGEVGS